MHDWATRNHRGPSRPTQILSDAQKLTSVELEGGTRLFLRSDCVNGQFATILVQGTPGQRGRYDLIVASLRAGRQPELVLSPEGRVAQIIGRAALQPRGRPMPRPDPPPEMAEAEPDSGEADTVAEVIDEDDRPPLVSSGTGFFVTADAMVTAAHVVRNCARVTLEDGTPVTLIAEDPRRDLAVLRVGAASPSWLRLQKDTLPRLGQTVAAVGFPFYGLAGEEIVLTTGNISSILDAEAAADRIMISAPVQPGNSGGPLLSAEGEVVGMVAARADDAFFLEMTGTMPQDMNFAIRLGALRAFLEGAGVELPEDGVLGMPITEGLAVDAQAAIRPVLCELPDEF
jgi:S1-C subfamily serine protease